MRKRRQEQFRQVSRVLTRLKVVAAPRFGPDGVSRGWLFAGPLQIPCAIGRGGIGRQKREGDGKTPAGRFALTYFLFRPDAGFHPRRTFRAVPIRRDSAWCDDPRDRRYNRLMQLPEGSSDERLWRDDHLYDVIGVLDYNLRPRIRDRGSAIFFHLARANFSPTAGCVALRGSDMQRLLPRLSRRVVMIVG